MVYIDTATKGANVKKDLYKTITDRIITALEKGSIPWRKPWVGGEAGAPRSLNTMKPYRGINAFLLALEQLDKGYSSAYWLTYRQAQKLGGFVRKGEKGTPVVYWSIFEKEEDGSKKRIPFLKHFTVFNLDQIDADGGKLARLKELAKVEPMAHDPIAAADTIADSYLSNGPGLEHGGGRAYYRPSTDTIKIPERSRFGSAESYYSVLFHEIGHSTGHSSRLARKGICDSIFFGSHTYSQEELVAEFTAAFLCGNAGIDTPETLQNSAAYIQNWVKVLKNDPKMLVRAAAQAQKAADVVLGKEEEAAAAA